mgnify:FL=1
MARHLRTVEILVCKAFERHEVHGTCRRVEQRLAGT